MVAWCVGLWHKHFVDPATCKGWLTSVDYSLVTGVTFFETLAPYRFEGVYTLALIRICIVGTVFRT